MSLRMVCYTCSGTGLYFTGWQYRVCSACNASGYTYRNQNNFNITFNGRIVLKDINEVFYPKLDGSEGSMSYAEFLEAYPDLMIIDRRAAVVATKLKRSL